ncbi:MAG: sensor histidine kinase [Clostridiales bacterium]|nr:sensor histidine kinase [Clostridiales bacterium]
MSKKRNREKPVSTGSIAFRIGLSSGLGLLLLFIVLDIVLLVVFLIPGIADTTGDTLISIENYNDLVRFVREWKIDILLKAEGLLVVFWTIIETLKVRSKLRPLQEFADAALKLSDMDGEVEQRYQKLESAIDMLSPAEDDQKLHTGDAELAGLETAVNKLMSRMRESYRQQARFVSDASHELRTPIAVIRGYADLLDRWGKTDEKILEESIAAIKDESESMQHLVEQLLFLARGDSGRTPLNVSDFDLSNMMKEVWEESVMIDKTHEYRFEDGGPIPARGDVALIKQAARILIENASKYTPKGGEIVLKSLEKDGHPAFTVQDSGIGISQSDIPHIFERFYRADDSRSKQTGGSGLGLAIARWIIDRHGGRFEVISRKDIGTRITVILP